MQLKPCPKCNAENPFRVKGEKGYSIVCCRCDYAPDFVYKEMEAAELVWNARNDMMKRNFILMGVNRGN